MDSASGRLSAALLLLYYIQGNYAAIYGKPLFDAPFVPLKESALPLTPEAKEVVDRVLDTFGMYSGKVLESITHKEAPWLDARKGLSARRNFSCGDFAGYDEELLQKGG